jgi:hypothetical protein
MIRRNCSHALSVAVAHLVLVRSMRCSSLFVAIIMLWLSSCDNITSRYATPDDARIDGLFDRGWLPDILPASSYDIRATTDLDLNRSEGEFSFDPADFPSFASQFQSLYQPFEYSAGGYTWVFYCDLAGGHCYYSMR